MHQDDFDFDYWMNLYKKDPERAEKERIEQLHKVIEDRHGVDTPKANRLKGIIWTTLQKTNKAKHPYVRMEIAATAMWKQFYKLDDAWKGIFDEDSK